MVKATTHRRFVLPLVGWTEIRKHVERCTGRPANPSTWKRYAALKQDPLPVRSDRFGVKRIGQVELERWMIRAGITWLDLDPGPERSGDR